MTLLIILVVLLLVFGGYSYYPRAGYTAPGYAPYGLGGILVLIVVLYLLGVVRF